jgi:hypothetical protein
VLPQIENKSQQIILRLLKRATALAFYSAKNQIAVGAKERAGPPRKMVMVYIERLRFLVALNRTGAAANGATTAQNGKLRFYPIIGNAVGPETISVSGLTH